MKFYQEGVILFQTIKEINNSDTLLAPSVISRITRLDSQIEQYLRYVHDEDIHTMCAELRDRMLHLTRALAQAQEANCPISTSTQVVTKPEIIVNLRSSRLRVSLPK